MVQRSMPQTPMHDNHNAGLLALIPPSSRRVIEVGCSTGAMAREWRRQHPESDWHGVEIDPVRAELARRHCQQVEVMDIEQAEDGFFAQHSTRDCWVFGDVLEHLRDPWRVLQRIRAGMSEDACVVACIPNVQHWSLQAALSRGEFRYVDAGLLDRTHLRWFTRQTLIELFEDSGFGIVEFGHSQMDAPQAEPILRSIAALAQCSGGDPVTAINDARAFQFLLRAMPE
jgi:SAM-dependent methyltransferase